MHCTALSIERYESHDIASNASETIPKEDCLHTCHHSKSHKESKLAAWFYYIDWGKHPRRVRPQQVVFQKANMIF